MPTRVPLPQIHPAFKALCRDDRNRDEIFVAALSTYLDELEKSAIVEAALAAADPKEDRLVLYHLLRSRELDTYSTELASLSSLASGLQEALGRSPIVNAVYDDSETAPTELEDRCQKQKHQYAWIYR